MALLAHSTATATIAVVAIVAAILRSYLAGAAGAAYICIMRAPSVELPSRLPPRSASPSLPRPAV